MFFRIQSSLSVLLLMMATSCAAAGTMPKLTDEQMQMAEKMFVMHLRQEGALEQIAGCAGKSAAVLEKRFLQEYRACMQVPNQTETGLDACMDNLYQKVTGQSEADLMRCMGASDEEIALEQQLEQVSERIDELMDIYPRNAAQDDELAVLQDKLQQLEIQLYDAGGENMSPAARRLAELQMLSESGQASESQLAEMEALSREVNAEELQEIQQMLEMMQKARQ